MEDQLQERLFEAFLEKMDLEDQLFDIERQEQAVQESLDRMKSSEDWDD